MVAEIAKKPVIGDLEVIFPIDSEVTHVRAKKIACAPFHVELAIWSFCPSKVGWTFQCPIFEWLTPTHRTHA